jgi:siroheme synthase
MSRGLKPKGTLAVVGTGIRVVGQLTVETIAWIKGADRVFYAVDDPVAEEAIRLLNRTAARPLHQHYAEGKSRRQSYEEMVDEILGSVREGRRTCAAFYGHPGVFAYPTHEAIHRAREEGYDARMLPAVSADDCLFAELGIDPARHGCQSYEATDFLLTRRAPDPSAALILWQVAATGDLTFRPGGYSLAPVALLAEKLRATYPADHPCLIYQAAFLPGGDPVTRAVPLSSLASQPIWPSSLLYLAPARAAETDKAMARRLRELTDAAASEPPGAAATTPASSPPPPSGKSGASKKKKGKGS